MFAGPLTKDTAEKLAARQFYLGFLFLPWLWVSNYLFFWDIMRRNPVIEFYCRWSLRCFVVSCAIAVLYWSFLRFAFPDSSLWIIKPGKDEFQDGIFTQALTKDFTGN
eukprot:TRINITY_DN37250_c0_g1_i1.p2 TRINITY_DN37250_c0_g1~~TRINITY_DN37250_c0_g1_i1.p2  ORF type:complete len:108 (+),score=48.14 TRINITY_DN37250_c0_g1_i1:87-410(+)